MRLFEHEDFRAICIDSARHFSLPEQFIEKDYYVTEALRIAAKVEEGHLIFKGGTSLSKGWHLLERFSEDLDLFLNPNSYDARLSPRGIDRELKRVRDAVASHPGLTLDTDSGQTMGGFGREDAFRYRSAFDEILGIPTTVKFEAGIQSGEFPIETVMISSFVADRLRAQGQSAAAEDWPERRKS